MEAHTVTPDEDIKLARFLHYKGEYEQAQALCRRILSEAADHVPSLCLLGDTLIATQREQEALHYYDQAMNHNPGHALAGTRSASLRFRQIWGQPPQPRTRAHAAPCLQMSTVGAKGRFGNQLFQYAFARIYAEKHGLELEVADWVGRDLFDLDDPKPSHLPARQDEAHLQPDAFTLLEDSQLNPQLTDKDLHGYFVPHTSRWAPYKTQFQAMFKPGQRIKPGLDAIVARIREHGKTLVAIHLRRGDFGYGDFWIAPNDWYIQALEKIWPTLDQPVLYIATDDPAARQAFARFNPIQPDRQGFDLAGLDYFVDHYIMSQADQLMISNSTFSFTAAMLNQNAPTMYRPEPATQSMAPFSPWDAQVSTSAKETVEPVLPVQKKFIAQLVQGNDAVVHFGRFCSPWTTALRELQPLLRVFELEPTDTLDAARPRIGLLHVQHVAIDDLRHLPAFLGGASKTLNLARVDFVHLLVRPGSTHLESLLDLQAAGFKLFGMADTGVYPFQPGPVEIDTGVLAINERIVPFLLKQTKVEMIDIPQQCAKYGIQPRGVIHVGAHEGKEIGMYESMGVPHVLYVEANPAVFERLEVNINERPDKKCQVTLLNRAISDAPGTLELHLASFDQSSSLLPMELHRDVYPQVQPAGKISVQASRLDDVMSEKQLPLQDFNLLNIDVQGAEAMVLRGAPQVLQHVDAVNVEISFVELYKGGALIEDVEDMLQAAGFKRVALSCPYHPTWGDAFYVKRDKL